MYCVLWNLRIWHCTWWTWLTFIRTNLCLKKPLYIYKYIFLCISQSCPRVLRTRTYSFSNILGHCHHFDREHVLAARIVAHYSRFLAHVYHWPQIYGTDTLFREAYWHAYGTMLAVTSKMAGLVLTPNLIPVHRSALTCFVFESPSHYSLFPSFSCNTIFSFFLWNVGRATLI